MKVRMFIVLLGSITCLVATSCRTDSAKEKTTKKDLEVLPADLSKENTTYVRLRAEPDGLNPLIALNAYARQVDALIFQRLLDFNPENLEIVPVLAKSRPKIEEILEDGKVKGMSYTFEILEEAKWDNGQPITGEDYVFTLKALFNPKVPAKRIRPYYDFISGIEIDKNNPKKFTVLTNKKYILTEDALGTMYVIPAYLFDPNGIMKNYTLEQLLDTKEAEKLAEKDPKLQAFADEFSAPKFSREKGFVNGSGAYVLEEWETGQHVILKKKENWWGANLGKTNAIFMASPDVIHFKILSDQTTALAALKSRDLDAITDMQPDDYLDLQKDENFKKYFNLHNQVQPVYFFTQINMKSPKLSDKRVRRALAHLMNVDEMINVLLKGMGKRTVGPIQPSKSYYHKDLPLIQYDFEKAKALLTEAGWTDTNNNGVIDKKIDGVDVEMELKYLTAASSKNDERHALMLQNNAKKAGIKIDIVAKNFTVKSDDLRKHQFELASGGWGAYPVPYDPHQIWHTDSYGGSGANYTGFGNKASDDLIEKIRTTLNDAEREPLYLKFQEMVYEEQPYIFLYYVSNPIAINKRFDAEVYDVRPGIFPNRFVLKPEVMGN